MKKPNASSIIFIGICIAAIVIVTLPYLAASRSGGSGYVFGGFLLNPLDGNSYLSKMYQGYSGSWEFVLPYTPGLENGSLLFLFYLLLGHVARWTGLSLIVVFHLARIVSASFMFYQIHRFVRSSFHEQAVANLALILMVFGSGTGWAALLAGQFTSDFWVAEAYPFLSAYANPHFPLTLGLLLYILNDLVFVEKWKYGILLALAGLLMALILPFGAVVAGIILGGAAAWETFSTRVVKWKSLALFGLGSAPVLLYDYWISHADPVLAQWNAQNITPSPPLWDFIVSFAPVIFFAIVGAVINLRTKSMPVRIMIAWLVLGIALMYLPWSLQRRFMFGLYVPCAGLASLGLYLLVKENRRRFIFYGTLIVVFSVLTNVFLLLAGFQGAGKHDPSIYMTNGEYAALKWIESNTPQDSVVLAAPDTGLLIPAYTGRQVIYGHPFETIHAEDAKQKVEAFFEGNLDAASIEPFLGGDHVQYIFWGPRESEINKRSVDITWPVVYDAGGVRIYAAAGRP